jgi:hypothetical protein
MAITLSDISFVYSGGSNNIDPKKSIGGPPSINPVNASVNNIFSDVKKEESEAGLVDYRCFYVFNDNESNSIFNVNVYLKSQKQGLSSCQIGLSKSTEEQVLSLSSSPISGSFRLIYENYTTYPIDWDNNYLIFQKNIENALNDLEVLSGVVVQRIFPNNYKISFLGDDNYRNHELLTVGINDLSPSTTVSVKKSAEGQPLNSIAPRLPTISTTPSGVIFYETSDLSNETKVFIGDLRPKDGVPIWIKRTTLGSVTNDENNGFEFRFSGNLVKNPTVQPFINRPCFYYE